MKSVHFTQLMRRINEIEAASSSGSNTLTLDHSVSITNTAAARVIGGVACDDGVGFFFEAHGSSDTHSTIYKFDTATGSTLTSWTTNKRVTSIAIDASANELYVLGSHETSIPSDTPFADHIEVFDYSGTLLRSFGGNTSGTGDGEFLIPSVNVSLIGYYDPNTDELYVMQETGAAGQRIQVFDGSTGSYKRKWTTGNWSFLALDPSTAEVYLIKGASPYTIKVTDGSGVEQRTFSSGLSNLLGLSRGVFHEASDDVFMGELVAGSPKIRSRAKADGTVTMTHSLGGSLRAGVLSFDGVTSLLVAALVSASTASEEIHFFTIGVGSGAGGQTEFYHLMNDGSQTSLGTPDGGVNVPAINAVYQGVPGSESQRVRIPGTYILQCRAAIERIVSLGTIENPKTGNPFNRDDGDITDNVHYVAMNALMRDYGLAGETLYSWARPIQTDFIDYYDVDIGELWRVVEILYDAARQQGLI